MTSRNIGETSELYVSSDIINNPTKIGEQNINEINFRDGCVKTGVSGILPREENLPRGVDFLVGLGGDRKRYGSNKSFIGSSPTIFNASKIMNIKYDVVLNDNNTNLETLNGYSLKEKLELVNLLTNPICTDILRSRMTADELNIISHLVLTHHTHNIKFVDEISNSYRLEEEQVKQFLYNSFLGKFHKGNSDIDFISFEIVENSNYIINLNNNCQKELLKSLLFRSAYIDKPSRSRHDYGFFFIEHNILKIKLCPQIRLNAHKVKTFLQSGEYNE